jgi:hypothetical protein
MPKDKVEILRVGVPVRAQRLRTLLDTVLDEIDEDTIVRHYNGSLIIEGPAPTLDV